MRWSKVAIQSEAFLIRAKEIAWLLTPLEQPNSSPIGFRSQI
jgi:hypothetical protein